MTTAEDDSTGVRRSSRAAKQAWRRTNEEMQEMAEARLTEGWEVAAIPALHTAPVSQESGDGDRFGFVHTIPNNHAETFQTVFGDGEFSSYEAYQNQVGQTTFLLTELIDEANRRAIFIAGTYETRFVEPIRSALAEEEAIFTYVKVIDGEILGAIRHEAVEPLLPPRE